MITCSRKMFIRPTVRVFLLVFINSVCVSFPFGFEGGVWDLIV